LLGLDAGDEEVAQAVRAAVLETDLVQLENGLETVVGPRGVRLSGGQRQRAAAARMFIRQAAFRVCDDLSSALDVETEQRLWEQLFARQDATIWSFLIDGLSCGARIRLLCSSRAGWRMQGGWSRCWSAARKCAACGRAAQRTRMNKSYAALRSRAI